MTLSPGQLALLKRASPDGYITTLRRDERLVAEKLVRKGVLRAHRGVVYELTQKGLTYL